MITRIATVAVVASLSTGGCIAVRYVPRAAPGGTPAQPRTALDSVTTADRAVAPGVDLPGITSGPFRRVEVTAEGMVAIEEPDEPVAQNTSVAVRVEATSPVEVAAMSFGDGTSPPCEGGHRALALSVDGRYRWQRPLVISGTHVVTGRFAEDPPLLQRISAVDLDLVEVGAGKKRVCVRVPVTGPGISHWTDKAWSVGARVAYRRALPFDPSSTVALAASVGRWLGPVRLGIEGFVGGTNDGPPAGLGVPGTSLCFFLPGRDCTAVKMGGFALESSGIAWRRRRLALGWTVSYEILIAGLHRNGPDGAPVINRRGVGSGVRVGLQLLRPVPGILGVSPRSPTSAWGLELFVAAPVAPRAETGGANLTWGIAVLGF